MKIGVGLPAYIPWVKSDDILEWARRADEGPFSSLGLIDRLVYPNYDPLITFAAAAAVTQRIRLTTTVLLAPIRNTAVLAKEAASLDALSGGRLTLGLGVGRREDDYLATQAPYHGRGQRLAKQIELMKQVWNGQPIYESVGAIGPAPVQKGGPELLIGGYSEIAIRRVGRLADGYISGGISDPKKSREFYLIAEKAWRDAGRPGTPRHVGAVYIALGGDAVDKAEEYLQSYYGQPRQIPNSPQEIRDVIHNCADVGMDELFLWPCVPELDQIDRLTEVVAKLNQGP
jgi:alkanesulfonate monooxygenase SsuD/methylene tetrahydromethanopterin reductase-like flavin-dependent oxidoreductase (luciferase family)